ncbi:Filament-like plant protein 4 [Abeliophyllum distichum]|uniref:Filament-like plant protein 4 n=1 Tax=Abeliophyllum distichum TaxID=126358 RepID=A0ABD1SF41_9LAMI
MDRKSWPWKKKSSSNKAVAENIAPAESESSIVPSDAGTTQADQAKQDSNKKPKYVQISVESYTHLIGLEDEVKSYQEQMKTLEEEVMELNEKLSAAHSEMTNKEIMVKQHAKVAEEAVSGWEKAEAEALSLKNNLESVTLLKLTAEDRASHLDGALKECMRQIRSLKEEHEQKLHDVVLNKTKQFDKMKIELEANIANLEQELLRSAAENGALSRSLQERSNMLIKLREEKSQDEAEIEILKSNIESFDREINSLKYELHIASKELEIRNEEKNMSVRSAEVANKQHLEGVKKIAKLEAECQRLRGLVRKKLPGPAALAQMKLEVENLGRDYGDSRLRRSPVKAPTSHLSQLPEFSLDNTHKYQRENELLTERLLAMEEETKMLKEALAKRNSELLATRTMYADKVHQLQNLEAQLHPNGEHKNPSKSNAHVHIEGSYSQNASNLPSLTSMSEGGNDDDVSVDGSSTTVLMSEHSHFKKEKNVDSPLKSESGNHLNLMDDFLEMEKIAYLSNDSNAAVSSSDILGNTRNSISEIANYDTSIEATTSTYLQSKEHLESETPVSSNEVIAPIPQVHVEPLTFSKLQSRISMVLESMSKDMDMEVVLEDIKRVVQDMHNNLHPKSSNCVAEAACSDTARDHETGAEVTKEEDMSSAGDSKLHTETLHTINQELAVAISQIYDFVMILCKEAKAIQVTSRDGGLNEKMDVFSAKYNELINCRTNLADFVLDLSLILSKASELHFNVLGYKNSEVETGSSDCIDKIALPENKGILDSSAERYSNGCTQFSDSTSDLDIPHDGNLVPTSELTDTTWKCSLEEFEQLKLEKDNMETDLVRCTENLESTKSQLLETELLLSEVKSQLTASQKLNSLSETQLKCMAESYRSLEARTEELQTEVNILQGKIETLDNELQQERRSHQDALARCKDLQEHLQRIGSYSAADNEAKTNQEELAAAAEKLEECQETILLLGKQLKALRPQAEATYSSHEMRSQKGEGFTEEEPTINVMNLKDIDPNEKDTANSINFQRVGSNSSLDSFNAPFNPSDSEANNLLRSPVSSKHPKHRPTQLVSSSSTSTLTPEKHSRGFSRFFSSKGKNDQ